MSKIQEKYSAKVRLYYLKKEIIASFYRYFMFFQQKHKTARHAPHTRNGNAPDG